MTEESEKGLTESFRQVYNLRKDQEMLDRRKWITIKDRFVQHVRINLKPEKDVKANYTSRIHEPSCEYIDILYHNDIKSHPKLYFKHIIELVSEVYENGIGYIFYQHGLGEIQADITRIPHSNIGELAILKHEAIEIGDVCRVKILLEELGFTIRIEYGEIIEMVKKKSIVIPLHRIISIEVTELYDEREVLRQR